MRAVANDCSDRAWPEPRCGPLRAVAHDRVGRGQADFAQVGPRSTGDCGQRMKHSEWIEAFYASPWRLDAQGAGDRTLVRSTLACALAVERPASLASTMSHRFAPASEPERFPGQPGGCEPWASVADVADARSRGRRRLGASGAVGLRWPVTRCARSPVNCARARILRCERGYVVCRAGQ